MSMITLLGSAFALVFSDLSVSSFGNSKLIMTAILGGLFLVYSGE